MQNRATTAKALILIIISGLLAFSVIRGKRQNHQGDYSVFWKAGNRLLDGKKLYTHEVGEREFIYPPFAAMVFIPLSLMPFKFSAITYFFLNFVIWALCFFLLKKCLDLSGSLDSKTIKKILFLTFFLSFKIFWNNQMMVQTNSIVLLFSLLGIISFLKGKENYAILYFSFGVSFKIIPIFFFFWLVIRGSKWVLPKAILTSFLFIFSPMIFSGLERGFLDLQDYYNGFLHKFTQGASALSYTNQSLSGALYRILTTQKEEGDFSYTLIDIGNQNAKILFLSLSLILFATLIIVQIRKRQKNLVPDLYDAGCFIIFPHLVSGISWKAHLVSLSLPFLIVSKNFFKETKATWPTKAILAYAFLLAISGKFIVGRDLQRYIGGYGGYTWLMLFLFVFLLFKPFNDKKPI